MTIDEIQTERERVQLERERLQLAREQDAERRRKQQNRADNIAIFTSTIATIITIAGIIASLLLIK